MCIRDRIRYDLRWSWQVLWSQVNQESSFGDRAGLLCSSLKEKRAWKKGISIDYFRMLLLSESNSWLLSTTAISTPLLRSIPTVKISYGSKKSTGIQEPGPTLVQEFSSSLISSRKKARFSLSTSDVSVEETRPHQLLVKRKSMMSNKETSLMNSTKIDYSQIKFL